MIADYYLTEKIKKLISMMKDELNGKIVTEFLLP